MYPMVALVGPEVLVVILALTTSGTPADIAHPGGKFLSILVHRSDKVSVSDSENISHRRVYNLWLSLV